MIAAELRLPELGLVAGTRGIVRCRDRAAAGQAKEPSGQRRKVG
jgi:hypothetical protein